MKIQVSQMALKCIKKTLSSKCCMNCLENDTTVVVITQYAFGSSQFCCWREKNKKTQQM